MKTKVRKRTGEVRKTKIEKPVGREIPEKVSLEKRAKLSRLFVMARSHWRRNRQNATKSRRRHFVDFDASVDDT